MGVHRRRVFLAWMGFMLSILGLLVLVASFFLLPLDVVPCFDSCAQPQLSATAWEYSLTSLRDLPASLVFNVCLLVLSYLPLLVAVAVVACSVGFLVRLQRTFARWGHRVWLVGGIALVLFLLVDFFLAAFFGEGPGKGFFGLLFGYGLLWAGNRVAFARTERESPET